MKCYENVRIKVSESGLYDVFSLKTYLLILLSICLVCVLFIVLVYQVSLFNENIRIVQKCAKNMICTIVHKKYLNII